MRGPNWDRVRQAWQGIGEALIHIHMPFPPVRGDISDAAREAYEEEARNVIVKANELRIALRTLDTVRERIET